MKGQIDPANDPSRSFAAWLKQQQGQDVAMLPADLRKVFDEADWFQGHQLIIWHGRRCCDAQRPECHRCVVKDLCPQKGLSKKQKEAAQRA